MNARALFKDRWVGRDYPPFVIAEMSGNHNGSLDRALSLVQAAAHSGAHALKLQTYTADTMTIDCDRPEFTISNQHSPWHGRRLYELYQQAHTPWEWHGPIFERAASLGMLAFSSPFDASAVDFLESLDVPAYKIASFEVVDLPLIRRVATTGKPVIISTGMATVAEIDDAVRAARSAGCSDLVLLKCTSTYPASPEDSHVRTVEHLARQFDCPVGLSDHTPGVGAAVAAVALGASVVEKHFTLKRSDGGVDSSFSLEPTELAALVEETLSAWRSLGRVHYGPTNEEQPSLAHRRSLYVTEDLAVGDVLSPTNLRAIRPGFGLAVKYIDVLLGKKVGRDVPRGTPMSWDLLD